MYNISKAHFIGYKPIIALFEVNLIGYKQIILLSEARLVKKIFRDLRLLQNSRH